MPVDYAEPSRRTPRRRRRSGVRQDAATRARKAAGANAAPRVSTGFAYVSGLCTGLFVALALWLTPSLLANTRLAAPLENWVGWLDSPGKPAHSPPRPDAAASGLVDDLSFYRELPRRQVWIPVVDEYEPAASASESAAYLLQAGSFRKAEDAERMRAELLLMGLEANTRRVELREGVVWYRVLVGPYDAAQPMRRALTRLRSAHIDAIPLRQG